MTISNGHMLYLRYAWRSGDLFESAGFGNHDDILGHIAVNAGIASFDLGDFIHHVHPVNYLAKNGVAPAIPRGCPIIKKIIVGMVDEKLC